MPPQMEHCSISGPQRGKSCQPNTRDRTCPRGSDVVVLGSPQLVSHEDTVRVCPSRKGGSDLVARSAISSTSPNFWGSLFKGPKPRWQLGLQKE